MAALMFSDAWHDAEDMGHKLELGWQDVEPGSWVAQCFECLSFLVLDFRSDMGREVFGKVHRTVCKGPPPVPPAPRRDPFMDEAALSPPLPKPANPNPPDRWWHQWIGDTNIGQLQTRRKT